MDSAHCNHRRLCILPLGRLLIHLIWDQNSKIQLNEQRRTKTITICEEYGDGGKTLGGKVLSLGGKVLSLGGLDGGLVDGNDGTVGMGNKTSKVAMGIGGIAGVAVGGVGQGGGSA